LTGKPVLAFFLPYVHTDLKDQLWEDLLQLHARGNLLGAATRREDEKERASGYRFEMDGIVSRHAYALLDMKQVNGHRLLRLRNVQKHYFFLILF
jgi:hypothetical protein